MSKSCTLLDRVSHKMVDAENLIRKLLEKIAIEHRYDNHTAVVKNSKGGNFTTILYRVTLDSRNKPTLKLFCKVVVFSRDIRKCVNERIFERELWFYTDLARTFDRIQDQRNVRGRDRFLMPIFYGCNPNYLEETYVFEDMSTHEFKTLNSHAVMNWEYASKVVEELAKFHALSMAYGEEEPEKFKLIIKKMEYFAPLRFPAMENVKKLMVDRAMEFVKKEHKDRLLKFLTERWVMNSESPFYRPLRRPVLTHGDMKTNNTMHRRTPDGNLEILLLDYQLLASGSAISDLMYIIFTGTDQKFRKKYFHQLLEHYYECLRQMLCKLKVDCDTVYPRQYFDEELETMLPYGMIVAVLMLPIILVEESGVPAVDENTKIADMVSRPSPAYGIRINEVVEEFVEWGIF